MRRNYYYIWSIILVELKNIITFARNAEAVAKGMVDLRSIALLTQDKREDVGGKVRGA